MVSLTAVPETKLIEKMKPRPVKENILIPTLVCAKKDRASKDALECRSGSLVIMACGGKIEVTQEVGETLKLNYSALLTKSKGCHPDGDQAVLAERKTEFGMADDLKEEMAIAPGMRTLVLTRAAQRYTA
jgi:hypothetical protein